MEVFLEVRPFYCFLMKGKGMKGLNKTAYLIGFNGFWEELGRVLTRLEIETVANIFDCITSDPCPCAWVNYFSLIMFVNKIK